jgi:hypothetical protein
MAISRGFGFVDTEGHRTFALCHNMEFLNQDLDLMDASSLYLLLGGLHSAFDNDN